MLELELNFMLKVNQKTDHIKILKGIKRYVTEVLVPRFSGVIRLVGASKPAAKAEGEKNDTNFDNQFQYLMVEIELNLFNCGNHLSVTQENSLNLFLVGELTPYKQSHRIGLNGLPNSQGFPKEKISYNCNGSTFVESFTTSGRRSVW